MQYLSLGVSLDAQLDAAEAKMPASPLLTASRTPGSPGRFRTKRAPSQGVMNRYHLDEDDYPVAMKDDFQ